MFGYSKQAYYKQKDVALKRADEYVQVHKMVSKIRSQLPMLGGRKLHFMLQEELSELGIKMGRDGLFRFLREEHLLVKRKRKYMKTTNSRHWMRKYPNKIKHLDITRPEQVWVADITYLQVKRKHYYLHLITDAYSKKIVGFSLASNMESRTTLLALKRALRGRKYSGDLIHHSDRGLQYCSKIYVNKLDRNGVSISMTEESDPYENAVAERINGILKGEFGLDENFENSELLEAQVYQSIALYNQLRPHLSIDYLTPNEAHKQQKVKLKTYKMKRPLELTS